MLQLFSSSSHVKGVIDIQLPVTGSITPDVLLFEEKNTQVNIVNLIFKWTNEINFFV